MNTINFKCKKEDFMRIDLFLNSQEYDEKPNFDHIELITEECIYRYTVIYEYGHYYIVTD